MTRRRYSQFFDVEGTLADIALKEEGGKALKVKKKKPVEFVPCQECDLYSANEDGTFVCKRHGKCKHLEGG